MNAAQKREVAQDANRERDFAAGAHLLHSSFWSGRTTSMQPDAIFSRSQRSPLDESCRITRAHARKALFREYLNYLNRHHLCERGVLQKWHAQAESSSSKVPQFPEEGGTSAKVHSVHVFTRGFTVPSSRRTSLQVKCRTDAS